MTVDSVNAIISRTATDPDFQYSFFANFDRAVAGYELTDQEKSILRTLTLAKLNTMVLKLQEWGEPPSTASLELMRFLFGDKPGQVVEKEKQQRPRSNRKLLVAIGAVVLLVVLAVGALMVLGAGLDGSDGGATQGNGGSIDLDGAGGSCPCNCVEEQRGAATITVCTDCDGNRCRPSD